MHHTMKTRILSMLLAFVMVMGMPVTVFATEAAAEPVVAADVGDFGAPEIVYTPHDDYYNVISKTDYILAPGITESEIVLNSDAGSHRQVAHVVEVDISNPYTKVMPSFKGMAEALNEKKYGTQIMSEQAAYAEANGYGNVVAAMNISLSWYNSNYYKNHPELVGEPLGYLVMDGKLYKNSQGQTSGAQTCLVINFDEKDGVARPADMPKTQIRSTKDAITGWEEQVIPANFGFLVKNGKNQYSVDNNPASGASRSFMGIKADGSIVMVMNDGRQSPYSTGFSNYEMAEFMLSMGCVYAVNGDGGGSSAFLSQRPGEELTVNCRPSDGAERPTTHGILVISTAPATGEFVRAQVTTEHNYYTPESSVQFTAVGSDLVGTSAEIPEEAYWRVTEDMGTIDDNGLFVSNGMTGEVIAELVYNEEVVGSAMVNIVIPDSIQFQQAVITVPNGEYTDLVINAAYGVHEVVTKLEDFIFELSDETVGTMDGFRFTATTDFSVTSGSITATFVHDTTKTATAQIRLGKASEIIWDFENGTDDWGTTMWKNSAENPYAYFAKSDVYGVDASSGKVHNGNGAMALVADFSYGNSSSWNSFYLNYYGEDITFKNAQAIGCWLYIPDEIPYIEFSLRFYPDGSKSPKNATVALADEEGQLQPGWRYVSFDISKYKSISFKSGYQFVQIYYAGIQGVATLAPAYGLNSMVTYYIDDVTIDYSTAVADREAPVFGTPFVAEGASENMSEIAGQTVYTSVNTFEAAVTDFEKDNAVGINASSAKAYVDGKPVGAAYTAGRVVASDVELADGVHTITFEIADGNGNIGSISRKLTVDADSGIPTVNVVPHDATLDRILIGSLYYIDINATDVEKTDKVVVTLDLNNHSQWELDHMTVADGFEASYVIDATDPMDKIATVTITRVGESSIEGEGTLASLPIRTWEWKAEGSPAYGDPAHDITPEELWADKMVFRTVVSVDNIAGELTLTDGSEITFGADKIIVDTELYANSVSGLPVPEIFEGKTCWHMHTPESVADLAPTCTKAGYTGRTYCAVCESVVDWGTVIPVTGHTYEAIGDQLACACGEVSDANGLVNVNGSNYYASSGKLFSGWIMIDDAWYYFSTTNYAGLNGECVADRHIKYMFDNGMVTDGVWETTEEGVRYWYGPGYYRNSTNDITASTPFVIDGKTYLFNNRGFMQTGIARYWSASGNELYYDCGEDGVATLLTGVNNDYFYLDGVHQKAYQLVQDKEGNFYFINDGHKIARNLELYLSTKFVEGKSYADGRALLPGYYSFGEDGKMIIESVKNGVVGDYLYINDVKQTRYKLVEFEGSFYFINDGDKVAKSMKLYLSANFVDGKVRPDGRALQPGYYNFDEDGKMIIEPTRNGVVGDYLYIDDVKQIRYKLVEFEGSFYFINDGDKIVKSMKLYLSDTYVQGKVLPDGRAIQPGYYHFDENGKMIIEPAKNGVVGDFLYIDDVKQTRYKLVEFEGSFYFINDGDKIAKSKKLYLSDTYVQGKVLPDGRALQAGYYLFDAEGKMIIEPRKHGIVGDYLYIDDVKQTRYKLVEFEGSYYFINDGDKIFRSGKLYLSDKFVAGTPFAAGYYEFDADGKLIIK